MEQHLLESCTNVSSGTSAFSLLRSGVMDCNYMCVVEVPVLSPCSWDVLMVNILELVELLVLESRVAHPHQIVHDQAGLYGDLDSGGPVLHGSQ